MIDFSEADDGLKELFTKFINRLDRPLEVKSGKNATHRSLDKFVEKFPDYVYVPTVLWTKDRKEKEGVSYLPIYMTHH